MWLKSKFRHCCLIINKTVLNPSCFWNITSVTEKLLLLCRLEFSDCQNNTNIQYLSQVSNFSLWLRYHLLMLHFFHVLDPIGSRRINMLSVYVFMCFCASLPPPSWNLKAWEGIIHQVFRLLSRCFTLSVASQAVCAADVRGIWCCCCCCCRKTEGNNLEREIKTPAVTSALVLLSCE